MRIGERTLPRAVAERAGLGVTSLILGIIFGLIAGVVLLTPMPPLGPLFTFVLLATEELLVASTVVCVLGLIWAVAMPAWVETLFRSAWKELHVALALGMAPIVVLAVLAAIGLML